MTLRNMSARRGVYAACGILADRCHKVQERLRARFPELEQADV
jgi:hypothetical protein